MLLNAFIWHFRSHAGNAQMGTSPVGSVSTFPLAESDVCPRFTPFTNAHTHPHTHTPLPCVWVCLRTVSTPWGCTLTRHTTEVSLETRFLTLYTEWGSPLSYGPCFAYRLFALILALSKSLVCVCILKSSLVRRWSKNTPPPTHTHSLKQNPLVFNSLSYLENQCSHLTYWVSHCNIISTKKVCLTWNEVNTRNWKYREAQLFNSKLMEACGNFFS